MGPEATVDLMRRVIRLTPALDDADHIRCIVDNNPKIPSRIKAIIEGTGESPGPCMAEMAAGLESAGADFLAIACNTAHHYYDEIKKNVSIPVIHIVMETLASIQKKNPGLTAVGLLASPAIRITRLYELIFHPAGIRIIYPDDTSQNKLFNIIKAVKAGDTTEEMKDQFKLVCENLRDDGAQLAVTACTELSALNTHTGIETVDAAEVLAQAIVDTALSRTFHDNP